MAANSLRSIILGSGCTLAAVIALAAGHGAALPAASTASSHVVSHAANAAAPGSFLDASEHHYGPPYAA